MSEADFRSIEGEVADVRISKDQEFSLANPVTFRITPLIVARALDLEIFDSIPLNFDKAGELGNSNNYTFSTNHLHRRC